MFYFYARGLAVRILCVCVCVCVCVFTRISDTAKFWVLKDVVIWRFTQRISFYFSEINVAKIRIFFNLGKNFCEIYRNNFVRGLYFSLPLPHFVVYWADKRTKWNS